jgi:hypothetical protein
VVRRKEAIAKLQDCASAIAARGATKLYLYGSTARDEAGPQSDLDLFIDYDPEGRFNAFNLVGLKLFLEERLGISVDLATRDGLHPAIRSRIEESAVQVF